MPRILIVDDEPGIRQSLKGVFEDEGFTTETVSTGEDCLKKIEQDSYDLVLLDIWLPQTVELTSERRGKRFHEQIEFSNYLLFAIDNKQQISTPKNNQVAPLRFARLQQSTRSPWY